jgi:hypothetical protein
MTAVEQQTLIEAEYQLEAPVKCGACSEMVESLQVLRLLRTRVNFTSSLPRRGFVFVCPRCQVMISGYLGTKIPF